MDRDKAGGKDRGRDVAACHMPQIEMACSTYLPTENKAWENSPCLLGAVDGHVFPGNVRWCWAAARERWSDPVPDRQIKTQGNYKLYEAINTID